MDNKTVINTITKSNMKEVAEQVSSVLLSGGVCIIPTDTIYGIVALDDIPEAVNKIYKIKKRPMGKPFIRLVGRYESIKAYTELDLPHELSHYWPGPLTIIFPARDGGTTAIRYPKYDFLDEVFGLLDYRVLVAPSANMSEEKNILEKNELIRIFNGKVDLIAAFKEKLEEKTPSTIVDITKKPWKIIRQGSLKLSF